MSATTRLKKALALAGAFFIAWALSPAIASPLCPLEGYAEPVKWDKVYDGDTLRLADGRRVRLIGINSPEMARKNRPAEPYATEAKAALEALLPADGQLMMRLGNDPEDRYERLLGYLFLPGDGDNLAARMLDQGLAMHVAVPPNLAFTECFQEAEQAARSAGKGLWQQKPYNERSKGGFQLRKVSITGIAGTKSWWLETDSDFVLQVRAADQAGFDRRALESLVGQTVEVRGWMYDRKGSKSVAKGYKRWVLGLRHPSAVAVISEP